MIPFRVTDDWMLITRWITPIVYQPNVFTGDGGPNGLGDLNPSFFLSPGRARQSNLGLRADPSASHGDGENAEPGTQPAY
jgi:phage-related minor tail protein